MARSGNPKKVMVILIDSLNPTALKACFEKGLTPAMQFLKERGFFHWDCISVFPTMTPACTSTIATGTMPGKHQVPGFVWFNRREKRFINYGASFGAIWKIGLPRVVRDLLFNLNIQQLSRRVYTIYELLEERGLTTASINFYIFRGRNVFETRIPWWVKLLTRFQVIGRLTGPKLLVIGEIARPAKFFKEVEKTAPVGPFNKFGVNDEFSAMIAGWLVKEGKQPELMMVYLPDYDGFSHRHNPLTAFEGLIRADEQIQHILNSYPSWEAALDETVFIVTGDHSQSLINTEPESFINLRSILGKFRQAQLGKLMAIHKEIAICPNERMAHIYILKRLKRREIFEEVLTLLGKDKRIDQIMWKEGRKGPVTYHVMRGNYAHLVFKRGGQYKDIYGSRWTFTGDLKVVDASYRGDEIFFGEYPDAFNRIAGLLDARHAGDVVITAKPGCEFSGEEAPVHPGCGSHGSLHRDDSLVPLIIAGSPRDIKNPRLLDFVPYILEHFGVELPHYLQNVEEPVNPFDSGGLYG